MACKVKEEYKEKIPAITHIDGSSRLQSVNASQNKEYYDLIQEFGNLSGVYVLLNTSFNDNGEPIVENYQDALLSFVRTGLQYLYVEGYLIERPTKERCDELKLELAKEVENQVNAKYNEISSNFCDLNKYKRIENDLNRFRFIEIFQSLRINLRRSLNLKFNENSGSFLIKSIKKIMNAIVVSAKRSQWKVIRFFAKIIAYSNYTIYLFLRRR